MERTVWLFQVLVTCLLVWACETGSSDKPNIVLILADDLGWSDIGAYGSEISTPHLDRLAETGIRFTQIHNTSKCFPSRACLLTGLYAQQVGYDSDWHGPLENSVTLGEVLQSAGYLTLWAGKHHGIENPIDRGFHHYFGLRDGAANHFNPGKTRPGEVKPAQKRPDRVWLSDSVQFQPFTPKSKAFYTTDSFTDQALEWLERYQEDPRPFFLFLSYTAPHDPLMAWPEDIAKYSGKYLDGYEETRQRRFSRQKTMGLIDERYQLSPPTYTPWDSLSEAKKIEEDLKMAVYGAMIDRLDQNIGRVISMLADQGRFEETVFLFLSDNGASAEVVNIDGVGEIGTVGRWTSLGPNWANVGNTPFRYYKNFSYQGGICTPLIVSWPKRYPGNRIESEFYGHFIDIMPTMVDMAGATYPESGVLPLSGESFMPLLQGRELVRTKPLFWEWAKGRAVRKGDWKLVSHDEESWNLFNMSLDPTEMNNLAAENPELVQELGTLFEQWKSNDGRWSRE